MVANSIMIFLMHINPINVDSMYELSFLNKRVSLVYGDTLWLNRYIGDLLIYSTLIMSI